MALTNKLMAIGDAIRKKTGKSELLTLDNMVKEIQNLSSEDLLIPQDYVDYVRVEATEVANKVREYLTDESIVCIRASDSHIKANSDCTFYPEQTSYGNLHAIMAIRALTYMIPVDFIVHNGDVSAGTKDTTPDALKNQIQTYNKFFRWASNGLPVFIAIGNHDTGIYYHQTVADGAVYTLPGSWLYDNFTAYSESDTTIFSGEEYGGYCYRDFPSKKLRVFLLNTSEQLVSNQRDNGTLESQQLWFANALKSLNVDMGSDWNIMVFSHYALDYGDARPITNVLKAYIAGESITVGGSTVNFSGYNNARFLYQGHGHHHCFLASKLHYYGSDSVMKEYNAWRLCCPNGEFNRNNYYAGQLYYGLDFGEPTTYGKTPNTAEDVSMIIEVTNPSEEKIHRICYGAGYHRTVGIGNVIYYGITKILSNVTLSNDVTSIVAGEPYSASLTINNGYDLKNISITMGEDGDITGEVYQNGIISIPSVTGDVVITIKASARPNFTNLVDTAIDTDGNIIKYTDGIQLSNSAAEQSASAFTVTGYIKTGGGAHTYRIAGDNISFNQYGCVIAFYNQNFEFQGLYTYNKIGSNIYYGTVTEEDSTVLTWTTSINTSHAYNYPYMRISVRGSGKNLIVTKDEEITYGGGAVVDTVYVTQNLTNVTSSNSTLSAKKGSSFETTLSGVVGYDVNFVKVIMDGTDVTDTVYTPSTGKITITNVAGDIVITASSVLKSYSVTRNLTSVACNNNTSTVNHGQEYSATLSVSSGYKINTVAVKMGDIDVTDDVYENNVITIPSVTGDIVITATAVMATYEVTYNLTDVVSSNKTTAVTGAGYSTNLSVANGYSIDSVIITMGGTDITSSAYTSSTGAITISLVTDDIIITAVASIYNMLPYATTIDGSTPYGTNGYKTNTRLRSSNGAEQPLTGHCVTGYIKAKYKDVIRIKNVTLPTTSDGNTSNTYIMFYNGLTEAANNSMNYTNIISNTVNGVTTVTVPGGTNNYIRLSCGEINDSTIITVNKEIV